MINQTVKLKKSGDVNKQARIVLLGRYIVQLIFLSLNILFFCSAFTFAQSNLDDLKFKISNGSVEEKRNALFTVRSLRTPEAATIAAPALSDANPVVRATAAASVLFLPREEAAKLLLPLLSDKDVFVRKEASFSLGQTGSLSATQPLLQLFKREKDQEMQTAVVMALGNIGDTLAIETLTSILRQKPKEENELLRRSSARSIGQIAQMILTGTTKAATPYNFLPEKYKQQGTMDAVQKIHQYPAFQPALTALTKVLLDSKEADDTRREAAFALGAIGDPASVAPLRSNLNSPDNYLAEICREALFKIEQPNK